ncbi:chemotaxis protein CheA [Desulfocurvus sp. DL9XJH121]
MDPAVQTYLEEAGEVLISLEEALLSLEAAPEDMEIVSSVFRGLHTIKGSGAMFGFEEIARFTHNVETVFDRVRNGELQVNKELLGLTFAAKDHLARLLSSSMEGTSEDREASDALLKEFDKYLVGGAQAAVQAECVEGPQDEPATFWIRYRPHPQAFFSGTNPLKLVQEMSDLGTLHPCFHGEDVPLLSKLDPEQISCWWDFLLHTDKGENAVRDVFIFVDESEVDIRRIGTGPFRNSDVGPLMELFGSSTGQDYASVCADVARLFTSQVAKRVPKAEPCPPKAEAEVRGAGSVRVDAEKLDQFVDMVGELVILQSRLDLAVHGLHNPVLEQVAEDLERLSDSMRDNALSIRMLPMGTVFHSFRRLVRDLSSSLGKRVEFVARGEETKLDKNILDKLKDPLMHILRNSMDHGLETVEERRALGKPETGTILLEAGQEGGEVFVKVHDDGKGMDPERIRAKALERGLLTGAEDLAPEEILNLVFEPGFSTADKVSDVSGRGVGMDVVKKGIDSLRGHVEIQSRQGEGTTIVIRLPLTLAIIDGLHVRVQGETYIMPLSVVEVCLERFLRADAPVKCFETVDWGGRMVPCVSLRLLLGVPGAQPVYEQIVIAEVGGVQVGLAVDEVVGRQQVVIKSLDNVLRNQKWVSGTAISGDGSISLILDVSQLVRLAESRSRGERH